MVCIDSEVVLDDDNDFPKRGTADREMLLSNSLLFPLQRSSRRKSNNNKIPDNELQSSKSVQESIFDSVRREFAASPVPP